MVSKQTALTKVFGDPQKRTIKRLSKKVDEINKLSGKYQKMTAKELRAFAADQRAIQQRAAEIAGIEVPRAKRKVPAKKAPRAARSGRRA